MLSRPTGISDESILVAVNQGWGIEAEIAEHVAVGFGSHHWKVTVADGSSRFVTLDDLRIKGFLGPTRASRFDSLHTSFEVAHGLHTAGLAWVVPPLSGVDGRVLRHLGEDYSIAVFPHVEGDAPEEYATDAERRAVVSMLAELHNAPSWLQALARRDTVALPNRVDLLSALEANDEPWASGPYSESARRLLRQHQDGVQRILGDYDALTAQALTHHEGWTLTHGEPHSANVLRTHTGLRLIDWDTVLVAPPERDLWMLLQLDGSGDLARQYSEATGHPVNRDLLRLYALWWDLSEVGGYLAYFRSHHADNADAAESWNNLQCFIAADQRWPT